MGLIVLMSNTSQVVIANAQMLRKCSMNILANGHISFSANTKKIMKTISRIFKVVSCSFAAAIRKRHLMMNL